MGRHLIHRNWTILANNFYSLSKKVKITRIFAITGWQRRGTLLNRLHHLLIFFIFILKFLQNNSQFVSLIWLYLLHWQMRLLATFCLSLQLIFKVNFDNGMQNSGLSGKDHIEFIVCYLIWQLILFCFCLAVIMHKPPGDTWLLHGITLPLDPDRVYCCNYHLAVQWSKHLLFWTLCKSKNNFIFFKTENFVFVAVQVKI